MAKRYLPLPTKLLPVSSLSLFSALRERWREGYSTSDLKADVMAGVVVGMVAVPLAMALAIATGVAPQYGLYTVIISGAVVALLGGSRFQVTGPTAAFVVILVPVVQEFGLSGLLLSGLMSGVLLVLMGWARMGRLIQFIPHPVTTGFTAGIAVVIATLQVEDFLGLEVEASGSSFLEQVTSFGRALGTFSLAETLVGGLTLALLFLWPKLSKKIPAPLVALSSVAVLVALLESFLPDFRVATIGNSFTYNVRGMTGEGIPQVLPHFEWPWRLTGAGGTGGLALSLDTVRALMPSAFAIAMLAAIESLLSAVVADGMTRTKHDPDGELVALGIGNILCPFFGGIPATGAIARTATNIRFGATSPIAAVVHALFTLMVLLLFAPYVSYLPMAALAALLIVVAYNMAQVPHFFRILRVAPGSDTTVLLICFFLTVVFDMVVGVTVGIVLAALLFMRRMASVTEARQVEQVPEELGISETVPPGVVLYVIEGPMFFGAAEKASETLAITEKMRAVIFVMNRVPTMDITGLVALESAISNLKRRKIEVGLVGLRYQPRELIKKSGLIQTQNIWKERTLEGALERFQ